MFKPSAHFQYYADVSMDTIDCNIFNSLSEFGLGFEDENDEMKNLTGGFLTLKEDALSDFKEVYFEAEEEALRNQKEIETIERIKHLMRGELEFDCFYLSKSYINIISELEDKANNPILPNEMQQKLQVIRKEFEHNITVVLRKEILENLRLILIDFASTNKLKNISQHAIHNQFNRHPEKIDQTHTINDLVKSIREFLKIDRI